MQREQQSLIDPLRARSMARRYRRRRLVSAAVLLIMAGIAWLWWEMNEPPEWWRPPDPTQQEVVDLGQGTEMFVLEQLHELRDEEESWAFRLRNDQINAWLAVNLPAWFEHEVGARWPEKLTPPVVQADEEGLRLGFQIPEQFGDRVIAARVAPSIDEDGVRLHISRVSIGQAPVPAIGAIVSTITDRFRERLDEDAIARVMAVLEGEQTINPVIELADGRIVEVLEIELEPDGVLFTCRTLLEADARERTAPSTDSGSAGDHEDRVDA